MAIKRVMGTETEYGITGGGAYQVVSAWDKGNKHYNAEETNESVIDGLEDHGHFGGDYTPSEKAKEKAKDLGIITEQALTEGARVRDRVTNRVGTLEVEQTKDWGVIVYDNGCRSQVPIKDLELIEPAQPEEAQPELIEPVDEEDWDEFECFGGTRITGFAAGTRQSIGRRTVFHTDHWGGGISHGGYFAQGSMLSNGARFYVDMGHPEYSTPECSNALEAVIADKAGERIVDRAAKKAGANIKIYKNNSDGQGNSYGCHENYVIKRFSQKKFRDEVVPALVPFFVTRQIYTGAGKIGVEESSRHDFTFYLNKIKDGLKGVKKYLSNLLPLKKAVEAVKEIVEARDDEKNIFQLSQRADFFTQLIGLQTTHDRPIINTRDEPHANRRKYMRLHVINGDANMSEVADYMKLGITSLVLDLIEDKVIEPVELKDPLNAFQRISRDQNFEWLVELEDGSEISAIDIQRMYLQAAQRYRGRDEITDDLLDRWERVLNTLETDPMSLDRELDWVIKRKLIENFMQRNECGLDDDRVKNINLQYHDVDQETGLFYFLQKNDLVDRLITDEQIEHFVDNPPETTRAYFRGRAADKFNLSSSDWGEVRIYNGGYKTLALPEPLGANKAQVEELLNTCTTAEELVKALEQGNGKFGVKIEKEPVYTVSAKESAGEFAKRHGLSLHDKLPKSKKKKKKKKKPKKKKGGK